MPRARVMTGAWARGREREVLEAVQSALTAALKTPDWDRNVAIDTYDETTRIVPTGRSDRYTNVDVAMFAGRSLDAKKALYRAIVANLAALGVPDNEINIVLLDVPLDNWGLRGGIPASEIDLGFKVDI